MVKYWESETPQMADTGANVFRYFKEAGKLQVSMPYWEDANGDKKPGKTVTIDVLALHESKEAMEILRGVLDGLQKT